MEKSILSKIRKLNWVLSESTTGSLSYNDLCRILSEIINANVLITDREGLVLGSGYTNAEDSSTVADEHGDEKIDKLHAQKFFEVGETIENLHGKECLEMLGDNYAMPHKYHCIVPSFCGGERMGTVIVARYDNMFGEEDIALCEYGSTVVGLEIKRNMNLALETENRLNIAVEKAIDTLSFTEKGALDKIFSEINGDEGTIVVSKIASKYGITNSVIVNAVRKLESAGVLRSQSLGMKGTRIKITNSYLRDKIKDIQL